MNGCACGRPWEGIWHAHCHGCVVWHSPVPWRAPTHSLLHTCPDMMERGQWSVDMAEWVRCMRPESASAAHVPAYDAWRGAVRG